MQDKNNNPQSNTDPTTAANAAVSQAAQGDFIKKVVDKIKSSENILVVLSRSPSIDEIAAALGLTMFLDGMQKHTTAIYSGRIPDSIAFLQPMETFETNTDSMQDFVISLDKDKADHLRYKLEGDYVKVFITPYKTIITQDDLLFSRGDFNVDFVIAINVSSAANLDHALKDHSRIMRDASVVNITASEPGRFGEIEWSNSVASSICEMITTLIFAIQGDEEKELDHDIATTLLSGIVAATERFSNNRTNPNTLSIASKLMSMGADQQLITSNISDNDVVHNEENYSYAPQPSAEKIADQRSNLSVNHAAQSNQNPQPGQNPIPPNVNPFANGQNPAAQVAPNPNTDVIPSSSAMINGTNIVTPESVIVQPVIPGTPNNHTPNTGSQTPNTPNTSPANPAQMQIPNTPAMQPTPTSAANNPSQMQIPSAPIATPPNPAQMQLPSTPDVSRNIMTEPPATPTVKQVGTPLTPPTPAPKTPKNYAEMMEAALSGTDMPPAPMTPMEPVANTASAPVLPPPPAPGADTNSIMPPSLPPVQIPPQM